MTAVDTWTEIEVVTGHATNPSVADSRTASILKEGHVLGVGNQVTGWEEHAVQDPADTVTLNRKMGCRECKSAGFESL